MRSVLPVLALTLGIAACEDQGARQQKSGDMVKSDNAFALEADAFEPIEPTVVGVSPAPTIWEALAPVYRNHPKGLEGEQAVQVDIRREGTGYTADVVATGLLDDAVAARHVRVEFRREPEGWWPTNAFVRRMCRRGDGGWTTAACT